MTLPLLLVTHNHREPIHQRFSWSTEIEVARLGNENRRSLRDTPTESLTYVMTLMNTKDATIFVGILANLIDMQVEFPRWEDTVSLEADVAVGGTVLQITNGIVGRHFEVDRRVLLYLKNRTPEIVTVATSTDPLVVSPLVAAWPPGTMVVPLEVGRIESPVTGPDLGNFLRDPTITMSVDEDVAGITLDAGPYANVAATVGVRTIYTGRTDLPRGGVLMLAAEAFSADGIMIPSPFVVWSAVGDAAIVAYPSGRAGRFLLKHDGSSGSASVTVTATVDGVSASATYSV